MNKLEELMNQVHELRMHKEARRRRDLRLALLSICAAILAVFCAIQHMEDLQVILEVLRYKLSR